MKRIIYILVLIFCLLPQVLVAQEDNRLTADFQVQARYGSKGDVNIYPVEYALFKTRKKAETVMNRLNAAIEDDGYAGGPAFDDALVANNVKFRRAKANGAFSVRAYAGQAVLVYVNSQALAIYEIKEGKTQYAEIVEFRMDGTQSIENTDVIGHRHEEDVDIKALPPIDDGQNMLVPVSFKFRQGEVSTRSRIIAQPEVIDCQTEDTVDYTTPLVYEGKQYHSLQNRRMSFDYMKNENPRLVAGYVPSHRPTFGKAFAVDTMLIYRKPDSRKSYKFNYTVVAEDLTHEIRRMSKGVGSCNKYRFFKFLDLTCVGADMPVDEFRVEAEETVRAVPRDLKLNFQVGKAELTEDTINYERLDMLVKEMKEYGDQLMRVEIEATASPDGGIDKNRQLAKDRGQKAMNLVMRGLGRADVTKGLSTKVFTWDDVAKQLSDEGKVQKADSVRTILASAKVPDALLRNLSFYETDIVPVLESMRAMHCVYKYEQMHVMDADELLKFYAEHKAEIMKGDKSARLSDGDYYNLLSCVTDSAELDTITVLAYNHMRSQPGWQKLKLSQYVSNRMALLQIRRGMPDLSILAPFIDMRSRLVTERYTGSNRDAQERMQMNRREVLINQIMQYYQLEKRDSAAAMLAFWFAGNNDATVKRLRNYVSFKENFLRYYSGRMTDAAQQRDYLDAQEFVLSSSPDNRAILYSEAHQFMGKTMEECHKLVDAMSDDNAKKWYLRGILEAKAEEQRNVDSRNKTYIPLYLAFFYQSFKLQPDYRLLYFEEAHVSDELREKYKYRKRDIPQYEELLKSYFNKGGESDEEELLSGDLNDE